MAIWTKRANLDNPSRRFTSPPSLRTMSPMSMWMARGSSWRFGIPPVRKITSGSEGLLAFEHESQSADKPSPVDPFAVVFVPFRTRTRTSS
jgi:hypothetical protein